MNFSYQVQIDGLDDAWIAITPESPHGPCDAVHLGDFWYTTKTDAQRYAREAAAKTPNREFRVVCKDFGGNITVVAAGLER